MKTNDLKINFLILTLVAIFSCHTANGTEEIHNNDGLPADTSEKLVVGDATDQVFIKDHADDRQTIAPDGSYIQFVTRLDSLSMIKVTFAPSNISKPVYHKSFHETWTVTSGAAHFSLRNIETNEIIEKDVSTNSIISIPPKCVFKFSTIGDISFEALVVSTPPFPEDPSEVVSVGF